MLYSHVKKMKKIHTYTKDFCYTIILNCRANRNKQRVKLELSFETSCPDSQQCVVSHMYPKVLSNPQIAPLVDFKAIPWGLAKRQNGELNFINKR